MNPNHIEMKYETPAFSALSQALLKHVSGRTGCPHDENCGDDTECVTENPLLL